MGSQFGKFTVKFSNGNFNEKEVKLKNIIEKIWSMFCSGVLLLLGAFSIKQWDFCGSFGCVKSEMEGEMEGLHGT